MNQITPEKLIEKLAKSGWIKSAILDDKKGGLLEMTDEGNTALQLLKAYQDLGPMGPEEYELLFSFVLRNLPPPTSSHPQNRK